MDRLIPPPIFVWLRRFHDDCPVSAEFDLIDREMCSLSCAKDATDDTLMVENFAFGHEV
jgi:hypothetical protein